MPYTGIPLTLEKKARLATCFTHLFESKERVLPRKDHHNSNNNNNNSNNNEEKKTDYCQISMVL